MSIVILKKEAEINAALAIMPPTAAEAARLLAHRLKEDPTIFNSGDRFGNEVIQVIGISCARNGIQPRDGNPEYERFVENQMPAITNLGISIAMQKKGGGWMMKAALVGIGLVTGIGF
jgi:hypothetical protein